MDLTFNDLTIEKFNFRYDMNITPDMNIDELSTLIDNEPDVNYFYISYSDKDVIEAINDELDVAKQLNLDLVHIIPQGIYVAMYVY